MYKPTAFFLVLIPCLVVATEPSPYAGEEIRSIKSLSEREITSLRRGDGMGFAKLAELNHFPGPKHVLANSDELGLSPQQIAETELLYDDMHRRAVALGEQILDAERQLDRRFADEFIDPEFLATALLEIGRLQAELRYVHLNAHLRQKLLLNAEQVNAYDTLRGYGATSGDAVDHGRHSLTD